jgi:SAM-dependent methyltransferase
MSSQSGRVFTEIYDQRKWGEGSGGGSVPDQVRPYIGFLNELILNVKPRSILDIGCGFGWLAAAIDLNGARYIGVDVVGSVVRQASRCLDGEFHILDATTDPLPFADLVILKEVTQHLDNASISKLLKNLERHSLVLHCSFSSGEPNQDIEIGGTRGVDLARPPFNLPCEDVFSYQIIDTTYTCQLWRPLEQSVR